MSNINLMGQPEVLTDEEIEEARVDLANGEEDFWPAAIVLRTIDALRLERDRAIAHDTQPYPTAWAYEQACAALHAKEAEIKRLTAALKVETVRAESWRAKAEGRNPLTVNREEG